MALARWRGRGGQVSGDRGEQATAGGRGRLGGEYHSAVAGAHDLRPRLPHGYAVRMSDSSPSTAPPPKSPEREAEIRELLARVAHGDLSGTIAWEQVAAELGLPGRPRS